ncbi:anti-adapter protein IraM [Escherichia coli]
MEWIVIDTVICSSSGITFSTVWCKIKLILWYQSDVFLPPGSVFTPVNSGSGVILDNKLLPITIYNVTPFNRNFWFIIKNNKECPGKSVKRKCPNNNCVLVTCPYGHK